jgi:hypothetical protein
MLRKIQRRGISRLANALESSLAKPFGSRFWVTVLAAAALLTEAACASRPEPPVAPESPAYSLEDAAIFTDLFRPELFNVRQSEPPELDGLLAERTELADSVYAARCVSVTREKSGGLRSYTVVVVPAGDVLAGQPPSGPVSLFIEGRSPAAAWLDMTTEGWVGTRFILFVRQYQDGPHFYATVDSPPVRLAILRATALRDRKK